MRDMSGLLPKATDAISLVHCKRSTSGVSGFGRRYLRLSNKKYDVTNKMGRATMTEIYLREAFLNSGLLRSTLGTSQSLSEAGNGLVGGGAPGAARGPGVDTCGRELVTGVFEAGAAGIVLVTVCFGEVTCEVEDGALVGLAGVASTVTLSFNNVNSSFNVDRVFFAIVGFVGADFFSCGFDFGRSSFAVVGLVLEVFIVAPSFNVDGFPFAAAASFVAADSGTAAAFLAVLVVAAVFFTGAGLGFFSLAVADTAPAGVSFTACAFFDFVVET